ncbi:hypothetical protein PLICRDRAFT_240712 [Plicaturopsis crispa FD-325 SS-3]|nr:hypothetical protein PLICRDRAFT_240712 [Plicaturopsis crispa FD-325 SS-3]
MSDTRRSGKLPARCIPYPTKSTGRHAESKQEHSSDQKSGSDQDVERTDLEPATRSRSAAKRVKTSSGSGRVEKPRVTRRKTKSDLFLSMPLDVLYEMFAHMTPGDLVSLTRASKAFRRTLLTRKSITVWKRAWENIPGVPKCPDDMSEPSWANLLYGGTTCQECGAENIQRIEFYLRRRVCESCLEKNLVRERAFSRSFPGVDKCVLDLILYTYDGAHSYRDGHVYYWRGDISAVTKALGTYKEDVKMLKPGAHEVLDEFISRRKAIVQSAIEHARMCEGWAVRVDEDRRRAHVAEVIRRFEELGYEEQDILRLFDDDDDEEEEVQITEEVTDSCWARIFPDLEDRLINIRDGRIEDEHDDVILCRKKVIRDAYNEYKSNLVPMQWIHHPDLSLVVSDACFKAIVDSPSDEALNPADLGDAAALFQTIVHSYVENRRQELLAMLPGIPGGSSTDPHPPSETSGDNPLPDELARVTSVFQCDSAKCTTTSGTEVSYFGEVHWTGLIGWADVKSHHICEAVSRTRDPDTIRDHLQRPRITFSTRGSTAAIALLKSVGLNHLTATSHELDVLDLRFLCLGCPIGKCKNCNQGRLALSWRQYISHFMNPTTEKSHSHSIPQFEILDASLAAKVKTHEHDEALARQEWSCNHCPSYMKVPSKYAEVMDHVRTTHGISTPQENVDLFHIAPWKRFRRPAYGVAIGNSKNNEKNAQCLLCSRNHNKLFTPDGVKSHLKSKHRTPVPVKDQHYIICV